MSVNVKLTEIWNELQIFTKNQKMENPAHIVVLCHILTIQVDKQGLRTFRREMHVVWTMSYELKCKEKCFWTCNMIISKYSRKYHLGVTKNSLGIVRAQILHKCAPVRAQSTPWRALSASGARHGASRARPECALKVFNRSTITNITNFLKCSQFWLAPCVTRRSYGLAPGVPCWIWTSWVKVHVLPHVWFW